jgi:hypothetical protein
MAELLSERTARAATMGEQAAAAKVDDAMRRGYLTPAMRGWATALCAQDPASFDGFLARATPAYAQLHQPSHLRQPDPLCIGHRSAQRWRGTVGLCATGAETRQSGRLNSGRLRGSCVPHDAADRMSAARHSRPPDRVSRRV